jgi:hypothetical protein
MGWPPPEDFSHPSLLVLVDGGPSGRFSENNEISVVSMENGLYFEW